MTDQTEHVITEQENALSDAMTGGDWETVETMRQEAQSADQTPPDPAPEDWSAPAQQFELDYAAAYARYQSDHEPHEDERVENTAIVVTEQNEVAPDPPPSEPPPAASNGGT